MRQRCRVQTLMESEESKARGAYYTPPAVAAALVRWAVRQEDDRLLDPSCGDGRFLAYHRNSIGIDNNPRAVASASAAVPDARVVCADFYEWAAASADRFECAVGNPPFIRYQRFAGQQRRCALALCASLGVRLSGLCSSWVPHLIATASLLRPGGRMAFVVPAEIGHAPYATPLLEWFAAHFADLRVVAVREKLFPELSEDVWLLFADGYGSRTERLKLAALESFDGARGCGVEGEGFSLSEWRRWGRRLRPMLLPADCRAAYRAVADSSRATSLGSLAQVGIGYVSGDNAFFHLRPSEAARLDIPAHMLRPSVRSGKQLKGDAIDAATLAAWQRDDAPHLLLDLNATPSLPDAVRRYLDTEAGQEAQRRYKCRKRDPWYVVPNVFAPDLFLSYMSSRAPAMVENRARCVCTNAVHGVRLHNGSSPSDLRLRWRNPLTQLSCEIEGHPLGGGVLKLEPREALRVVMPEEEVPPELILAFREGTDVLAQWRHRG